MFILFHAICFECRVFPLKSVSFMNHTLSTSIPSSSAHPSSPNKPLQSVHKHSIFVSDSLPPATGHPLQTPAESFSQTIETTSCNQFLVWEIFEALPAVSWLPTACHGEARLSRNYSCLRHSSLPMKPCSTTGGLKRVCILRFGLVIRWIDCQTGREWCVSQYAGVWISVLDGRTFQRQFRLQ